ncbi:putative sodium-coupled neutral amino acid transporter 11 isoform X2 [Hippoglossus hippoglossus]|uniref:putative sodium-coupled neutral amino acid transporter 11 isoform X2 n=1 Tax=Hippoglossus hippoglossus TaxID=8267 RepID=UPI00148E42E3|nr:putative sodium-coupled neutral amino acid transporter 11 isoform X2 [Hippoglossus hippoglossus]
MAQQLPHEEGTMLIHPPKDASGARRSTTSATFNFINSIIGSGIIGLPYALNQAGLPFGLLLLVIVALITDYSIILLIRGGNLSGTNSYQSLVQSTFGFPGFLILSALQFLYPFIAMVSLLSMVLTLTILIIVIIRSATFGPQILPTENAWAFAKWNAIQAVGVMSFAFICHHNSFLIYGSLEQPTLANWSQVTHVSVGSALIISAAFAVAGYTTFTGFTQGDIFENYCRDDNLATFGRFCFGLSIITTFPLECFVTREVLSNVFFRRDLSKVEHVVITMLIVAVCTSISLAYDCLGVVLELNGALSATPLIFIIPSACILKLSSGRWYQGENLIATILIIAGLFVMITGLTMTGLNPQDCSHGAEMFYCADANISGTAPPV